MTHAITAAATSACTFEKPSTSPPTRHWSASLALQFTQRDSKTRLAHCAHEGPLRVQRLLYPEANGKAHCYILHPPGGVATGDELTMQVDIDAGEALITTPSAGRFYTVGQFREPQVQCVHLRASAGRLEWLPQETLLFNGVNARLDTRIDLASKATLAYWDVLVFGRPACGETFTRGEMTQTLSIYCDERIELQERLAFTAGDRLQHARMGLNGASTIGICVLTDSLEDAALGQWLQRVNSPEQNPYFSVTQRGRLLIARYRGDNANICREGFADLWCQATLASQRQLPQIPRIWNT